jgi:homoserine acetyltransferase
MMKFSLLALVCFALRLSALAQVTPVEGEYTARNFKFESGESLPELTLHYPTLGEPRPASGAALMPGGRETTKATPKPSHSDASDLSRTRA